MRAHIRNAIVFQRLKVATNFLKKDSRVASEVVLRGLNKVESVKIERK